MSITASEPFKTTLHWAAQTADTVFIDKNQTYAYLDGDGAGMFADNNYKDRVGFGAQDIEIQDGLATFVDLLGNAHSVIFKMERRMTVLDVAKQRMKG